MIDAIGVHILNGVNELQDSVADRLGAAGSAEASEGLVEVPIVAVFQNQVDVVLGFKRVTKIDNVGVITDKTVNGQLL
jgi:hypothetical protein